MLMGDDHDHKLIELILEMILQKRNLDEHELMDLPM